jgi:hypothetical protein
VRSSVHRSSIMGVGPVARFGGNQSGLPAASDTKVIITYVLGTVLLVHLSYRKSFRDLTAAPDGLERIPLVGSPYSRGVGRPGRR